MQITPEVKQELVNELAKGFAFVVPDMAEMAQNEMRDEFLIERDDWCAEVHLDPIERDESMNPVSGGFVYTAGLFDSGDDEPEKVKVKVAITQPAPNQVLLTFSEM